MVPYSENILKRNRGSGWKQSLERWVSLGAAKPMHGKEKTLEADPNEKPDDGDWKEGGGWFWF